MMNDMDRANRAFEDSARRLAEERSQMQAAHQIARCTHSRSGLLANFLRRLADSLDRR